MSEEKREPVEYIVMERSVIDNQLYEEGQRVKYAGLPSKNLQPTDAEGRARAAEFERTDKERANQLAKDNADSAVGDPEKFAAAFAKELAKASQESNEKIADMQRQSNEDRELMKQMLQQLSTSARNAEPPVGTIANTTMPTAQTGATIVPADAANSQVDSKHAVQVEKPAADTDEGKRQKSKQG